MAGLFYPPAWWEHCMMVLGLQVTGRLLTGNDQVAASVTRPWLLPYRSPFSQRVR